MVRASLLAIALISCAVSVFAGEYLISEDQVLGLRVVFSEPVTITAYGDVFTTVKPQGEATEFVFSGGVLSPWVGHWLNWEPLSAELERSQWLQEAPGAPGEEASRDRPEVQIAGRLLDPHYFTHPAYVMQGAFDRDEIFALPLGGIPELGLYPIRREIPSDQVDWSVEVDGPAFEVTALHCLGAGILFTPVAVTTGLYTWWLNYLAKPLRPVDVKKKVSLLLLATQIVVFVWRLLVPDILDSLGFASAIYFMLVLSLFILVTVNGWFGASMTFPIERD